MTEVTFRLVLRAALALALFAGCATTRTCPMKTPDTAASNGGETERSREQIMAAVLKHFPEAYDELSTLTYGHTDGEFYAEAVMVLVPAAKAEVLSPQVLKDRACAVKRELGWDCACENVELSEPKDYAWHSWPDKRVVQLVVNFLLAC